MNSESRAKLIERVQSLQGLTDDERSALLELLRTNKQYGLVWENKPENVEEKLRDELPVLIEDKDKALTDGGDDAPNHILIEGDNLEALTTLAYTHAGKIDVIYIDPPYNTGNKDFVYNDSYVDTEDSYRHSKWLSFMSKRLRIAKKLLSDRGVIFISIDDNEQANLKLLCDDLFGEKNFVTNFIWEKKKKPSFLNSNVGTKTDYIICYSKNRNILGALSVEKTTIGKKYPINNAGNSIANLTFPPGSVSFGISDGTIEPQNMSGGNIITELLTPVIISDGKNSNEFVLKGEWRYSQKTLNEIIALGEQITISKIPFRPNHIKGGGDIKKMHNLLTVSFYNISTNEDATAEQVELFNEVKFDYAKPTGLINLLVRSCTYIYNDSTILDFFAGSGTTMQAVMQLNAEDGGHRKCILVTNNENNICEDVTYERNKRVINGYTKPNGEAVDGLHSNNLRYYRTAFVGRSRSPQNLRKLVRLATDMLCIKEDLYDEQTVFAGQDVVKQAFRYFEKANNRMLVIYREEAVPLLIPLIAKFDLPEGEKIKVYVFSPSEDPWAGSFEEVADKVGLCALPMAILNAYKRVLPKQKDQNIYVEPDMVPDQTEEENEFSDTLFPGEGGEA